VLSFATESVQVADLFKLRSMGLVTIGKDVADMRYPVYRHYFAKRLR